MASGLPPIRPPGEDTPGEGAEQGGARALAAPSLRLSAKLLEIALGLLLLVLAIVFWFGAGAIDTHARGLMSARAFPRGIALLLGFSALALTARAALRMRTHGPGLLVKVERPAAVGAAMAMAVLYPVLIDAFGYYIATGLWLPPLLWIAGYRRPLGVLACSAGFLVFTRIIFQHVLGTPMP